MARLRFQAREKKKDAARLVDLHGVSDGGSLSNRCLRTSKGATAHVLLHRACPKKIAEAGIARTI